MKKDDTIYLEHIEQSLNKIIEYAGELTEKEFLNNSMVQDACIRQFEIIGEAAKRISSNLRDSNPEIPWKDVTGMRDKLIHDYIDIDLWVVLKTVKEDVPMLLIEIEKLLQDKK